MDLLPEVPGEGESSGPPDLRARLAAPGPARADGAERAGSPGRPSGPAL